MRTLDKIDNTIGKFIKKLIGILDSLESGFEWCSVWNLIFWSDASSNKQIGINPSTLQKIYDLSDDRFSFGTKFINVFSFFFDFFKVPDKF